MFYIGYLVSMLFIVVAVEAINLCCKVVADKRPIKCFDL